jgi:hypothetical protein
MDRPKTPQNRAAVPRIARWLAAVTLAGCAAAPDVQPTYAALDRGFRSQCQDAPDREICVRQKFLALQERRRRQLALNECAVKYGWTARTHWGAQCRNAPEPQKVVCRTLFGTMTCTIADDAN